MQKALKLVIGNKNYSSWSLRPWLVLEHFGIPFEEEKILLDLPDSKSRLLEHSGSGKVPVLIDGGMKVWDSIAIIEYLADRFPERAIWPASPVERAEARCVSAEMHAGFPALRQDMPLNCRARDRKVPITDSLQLDISRVIEIWSGLRSRSAADGPWLFGEFSAADAMYAPVALRFATYGVAPEEPARSFMRAILEHPAMKEWSSAAEEEREVISSAEVGSVCA
jgi:glutathione S-transferase